MLKKRETFLLNDSPREYIVDFPILFIMTADGYLKLEELKEKDETKHQKKTDYYVSLGIALLTGIVVASLSSIMFHYFAIQRVHLNTPSQETSVPSEINEKCNQQPYPVTCDQLNAVN